MRGLAGAMAAGLAVLWGMGSAQAYTGAVDQAGGLALHGDPALPPDFAHLPYANPDAPKGGTLRLAVSESGFDSLNPFILRGESAAGVDLIFESLMEASKDEPFAQYGLLAESVSIPADVSSATFVLRPQARWQDGQPVTAADVVWSFDTLRTKGAPFYRSYYADVDKAEALDPRTVRFVFKRAGNRELPLILGQMSILPQHWWAANGRDFEKATLEPLMGSGPYRIETLTAGRQIVYQRDANWWAKDLPIAKGRYNFDRISYDYYRTVPVAIEGLIAGQYDLRFENSAKNWATAYDVAPVQDGRMKREEIKNHITAGMQGFVMNSRRPLFHDRRVRQALGYAFDFEWSNKNVAFGAYTRTKSYFDNSELGATGLPSAGELALLNPWRGKIPDEVFTTPYAPPVSDGSGQDRALLRKALALFKEAGWELRDGVMTNTTTGQPFAFEIVDQSALFDRWVQPFLRNLERLGVKASFRVVDSAQYQNLMNDFNFDMTIAVFPQSQSPGNEQADYWGSSRADVTGSRNILGVKDPAVDALVDAIITAPDRAALVTATRALDRVLLWNHFVIPHYHGESYRLVYWDKFAHPDRAPQYGLSYAETWWAK